ncbi:MAG: putative RNA uridine N3 methyltransferase [Candidatus Odinarchaeia archaeon]
MKLNISVLIPSSLIEEAPDLRLVTYKLGHIARLCAIYCVNKIIIYNGGEKNHSKNSDLIYHILKYIECPQYMRKQLFPLDRRLKYVGYLPPLGSRNHPVQYKIEEIGEKTVREGVVVEVQGNNTILDLGFNKLVKLEDITLPLGKRVIVEITKDKRGFKFKILKKKPYCWGFTVIKTKQLLGSFLKKNTFSLTIGTSKRGVPIFKVAKTLGKRLKQAKKICLAFGAPYEGIYELLEYENMVPDKIFDFVVNVIPDQGVRTVRTEEALGSSLAIFTTLPEIF